MAAPMETEKAAEVKQQSVTFVVLVDATGSMGSYCSSVGSTLQQLFAMLDVLFEGSATVRLVAYEDYCDGHRVLRTCSGARPELKDFAGGLRAGGGGDTPEAVKTALNRVVQDVRDQAAKEPGVGERTFVIHYTDAPPHHRRAGSDAKNYAAEETKLKGQSPGFDWVRICETFRELGCSVVTFLPPNRAASIEAHFMCLLGDTVELPDTQPESITKATMGYLLQLMGQQAPELKTLVYAEQPDLVSCKDEQAERFVQLLTAPLRAEQRQFLPHPAVQKDLRQLIKSFQESKEFQDVVFEALKQLLVPENVVALTYNSVLGLLWRLVCKQREDPRVPALCDALSECCTKLTGPAQAQLRTWVDESYNQAEEITQIIKAVPAPLEEGVLVLDVTNEEMPTKEEMRSLMHAPLPGVLRKVQQLLSRLVVVKAGALNDDGPEGAPTYLPLAMKDKDLFATIPHLLLPGLMLSVRPAAMIAILAQLSGNATLQPRAERFLQAWKGKWIPPMDKAQEYPEILNAEFVRLVVRVPDFLTDGERELYLHLNRILRVRRAQSLKLKVKVGYTPKLTENTVDHKATCKSCEQPRSKTLLVDGVCGVCLADVEVAKNHPEPEETSHMVECRTCHVLYAVICVEDLNVAPKCHYCRQKEDCPAVTCRGCHNRFCAPTERTEDHLCKVCELDATKGLQELEVALSELVEANPPLFQSLGFSEAARPLIFGGTKLFKLWTGNEADLQAVPAVRPEALTYKGKPVMNVQQVLDDLLEKVQKGRLAETCNLCCEDRALPALRSACGHCATLCCESCLRTWYGKLAPGKLYCPSEGLCPFCKRTPKATVLRAFNRAACRLSGRRALVFRPDMYYGWCRSCFKVAEAMPRECAQEAPELRNFECEPCQETALARQMEKDETALARRTRKCPGCQAPTVKISGCDHITCTQCPAHWCWACGKEFPEDQIYQHMDEEHGDWGIDGDDGDDFEE